MSRTFEERIQDLQRRKAELIAKEKELAKRQIAAQKKEELRRVISIGRTLESEFGTLTDDQLRRMIEILKKDFSGDQSDMEHSNNINTDNTEEYAANADADYTHRNEASEYVSAVAAAEDAWG